MKRKMIKTTIIAMVMSLVLSTTVSANEGYHQEVGTIVFIEEEEPAPTPSPEPTPEPEPTPQPEPQPEPTPTPEPTPEPAPQPQPTPEPEPTPQPEPQPEPTPTPEPTPAPTPSPKEDEPAPSQNEEEHNEPSSEPTVDPTPATPVVTVEPEVQPSVVDTVVENKTSKKKSFAKAVSTKINTDEVGVNRVEEYAVESETTDNAGVTFVLGSLLLLALLGLILFLLMGKRNYVVVRRYTENGNCEVEELKKFFNIEKACEFVRDYQWDTTDESYDALNILNTSRDEEAEDEDGNVENQQLVYIVSEDHEQETIYFANDDERDAIGRILGFVEEVALA